MSELPTTGRANADYKFRPNYYAQLNDKIARVGFTLGFDRFHVCSYTAINSPRGRKNLNLVSQENVIVNKGKLSLTNQKYGFNVQK